MTGTPKSTDPDLLLEASRVMNAAGTDYANATRLISDWALQNIAKAAPLTRAEILGDAAALRLRNPDRHDGESGKQPRYEEALALLKDIDTPECPDPLGRLHMLRALANGQKYNALKRRNNNPNAPAKDITPETMLYLLRQDIRDDLAIAFKRDKTAKRDNAGYWQQPDAEPPEFISPAVKRTDDSEDDLQLVFQDDKEFQALVQSDDNPSDARSKSAN